RTARRGTRRIPLPPRSGGMVPQRRSATGLAGGRASGVGRALPQDTISQRRRGISAQAQTAWPRAEGGRLVSCGGKRQGRAYVSGRADGCGGDYGGKFRSAEEFRSRCALERSLPRL